MVDYKKIGEKIAKKRNALNITQEQLGNKLQTSASYVSNIENGVYGISFERLVIIANELYKYKIRRTQQSPSFFTKIFQSKTQENKRRGKKYHFMTANCDMKLLQNVVLCQLAKAYFVF